MVDKIDNLEAKNIQTEWTLTELKKQSGKMQDEWKKEKESWQNTQEKWSVEKEELSDKVHALENEERTDVSWVEFSSIYW